MQAERVRHYVGRAVDFLNGMNLMRDDEPYLNSSALLAIHSAISYTDALRCGLGDASVSSDDHRSAVSALQKLLPFAERKGLRYLQDLLSKKSDIAYGSRRIEWKSYQLLVLRAEQYAKWANTVVSSWLSKDGKMMTNEALRPGRAKNAVLTYLEKRLVVPKIYLDAVWNDKHVDVLAIDRDGVGDVHVVLLAPWALPVGHEVSEAVAEVLFACLEKVESLPAQYKYVVLVDTDQNGRTLLQVPAQIDDRSFALDGIGRVGFLAVDFPAGETARVHSLVKPERFRAKIAKLADEYVQQHEADWEIRA